ncbi:hypothetical protein ACFVYR_02965 [Streptomyces sp. NPDC058284]|uniref:hypothetical protein n=1 Tax=unclassified Streptomyces TaxID=2593676 RepID=UPI003668B6FA
MTHNSDTTHATYDSGAPAPRNEPPRLPRHRPAPRSREPRFLARMLPGTDEPPAPDAVGAAFALWLTAVAAGVFATVLAAVAAASGDGPGAASGRLAGTGADGLPLRMAVLAAAVLVAVRMRRGVGWARPALACGLGAPGVISVLAGPARHLAELHAPADAFRDAGAVGVLLGASSALHLAAVLAATVLMFRPAANAWFRAARGR